MENSITQTALSTAETKVETELTAEQLAEQKVEANIVKQFGAKALAKRKLIQDLVQETNSSEDIFFLNRVNLGTNLVDMAKEFGKKFWSIVDTSKMSKKTFERAMELVLDKNVKLSNALSIKGGSKDIKNNLKLLKLDPRVQAFKTVEDIENIYDLNLNKINNAKPLSDKIWNQMCSGEDKPFQEYMEAEKKKAKAKTDKQKEKDYLDNKPASMSEADYMGYYNVENIVLINQIADLDKELKRLEKFMGKMPTSDKVYETSNETESEKV